MHLADLYAAPADWQRTRIDAVSRPVRYTVDPSTFGDQEVFHISIPALDAMGDGRRERARTIESQKLGLRGGEVLVSKLNPRKSRVVLVGAQPIPILASGEFIALEPHPECDGRFLVWLLRSRPVQEWLDSHVRSVTRSHQRVDPQVLTQARVWVPSLDRQRQIVAFLERETSRLDALLDKKRRLITLLNEKRTALASAAVSGDLGEDEECRRPSDLSWVTTMPSHWRIAKLSLVARLGTGHTPSRTEAAYWEAERDIPWLTTSDIERFRDDRSDVLTETKESITRTGLENSSAVLHPAGTVALSRTASVGFSVIMGRDMATSQDFVTWTCLPVLDSRFLLLCLRAMRNDLLGRLAMGSTHKTIYMPDIQGLRVPVPPISEQQHAVRVAGEQMRTIDEMTAVIDRQLPLLAERRDAIVTAAVSGQLDPSSYDASAVTA